MSPNYWFFAFTIAISFGLLANGLLPIHPASSTDKRRDDTDGRLNRDFIPFHYDIEVAPDFYGSLPFPFTGSVAISVRCDVPGFLVTLNSKFLSIQSASVEVHPESPVSAPAPDLQSFNLVEGLDFLNLNFRTQLVADAWYIIRLTYSGELLDPTQRGIYYDYYVDSEGVTKYMVATQFESIFARQMFPCFDEPDFKATFSVVVVRKPSVISLSNMNKEREEERANGWIADYYAKSPVMSTYLVCICIGEFEFVEAEWQGVTSVPVRIYARREMLGYLGFAAKYAAIFQAWLEEETGIPYNLPKMDHIALPSKGGAMENWGLITYGEPSICINPETSAANMKLNVASIISHELAHQWYGNTVTTKWWDDIWLNEGFATNYNYDPTVSIGWPAAQGQQSDPRRGTQQFLDIDQRNNSDPVIKQIVTVWQAPDSFSGSTYPKGGAMVRALKGLLGQATFNRGLESYLNKFSSSNAITDDLWAELTNQAAIDGVRNPDGSPLNVKTVMDAWLRQMGYPLLRVTSNGDGTAVVTSQRYFNPRGQTPEIPSEFNYQWNIPITVATRATTDWDALRPSFYLNSGEVSTTLTGLPTGAGEWFLLNAKQMFFYRVDYDSNSRAALVNQLLTDHTVIPAESRSQLVDDTFSLARALFIPETDALEVTRYLGSDLTYSAWNVALKHLLYADRIYQKFSWYSSYQVYLTSLVAPVYDVTGWEYNDDEPALTQLLRKDITSTACFYGYADCLATARDLYNIYHVRPDVNSVNPNALPTVLCLGVSDDPNNEWVLVFNQYQERRSTPITDERNAYLYGMSCSTERVWLDTYLNAIIRGVQIDTRDQTQALNYLIQNNIGLEIVWNYFQNSWTTIPSTIGKFTVLRNIASTWYTQAELNSLRDFIAAHPPSNESQRNLLVQIELLVQQNVDWAAANAAQVEQWLAGQMSRSGISSHRLASSLPASPLAHMQLPFAYDDDS